MLASLPAGTLLDCMSLMMPALNHHELHRHSFAPEKHADPADFAELIETSMKPVLPQDEGHAVLKPWGFWQPPDRRGTALRPSEIFVSLRTSL